MIIQAVLHSSGVIFIDNSTGGVIATLEFGKDTPLAADEAALSALVGALKRALPEALIDARLKAEYAQREVKPR